MSWAEDWGFPKNPVQTWCLTASAAPGEGSLSLGPLFPTPSLSLDLGLSQMEPGLGPLHPTLQPSNLSQLLCIPGTPRKFTLL